ncbi:TetR/AcrR family transcriptional regulator [Sporosarcina contaminans]|uniref:TetR/AcrR family transcriptional regulator n=1 Tax=Sporosarcina contaminans TaxID=633403 RepID=A0ABW3U379_9BACL
MSSQKSAQRDLSREMIMDAAKDLFIVKGYQHVSMRQIAKELGYSHGAIYYHFNSKAELFYALVEDHFSMLEQKLKEIAQAPLAPIEKLEAILLGYIEFGLNHQSHYEIMFLIKDEEVRNFLNQSPNETYELFAQTVHSLCEKQLSIQEIWSIFLALHGFVTHYLRHVIQYEEVRDMAKAHVQFLLKGIN